MPRQSRYTDELIDEIVARYEAGESRIALAKAYKAKADTIRVVLERRGVDLRPAAPRKYSPDVEREIAQRYREGEKVDVLLREYGCTPLTLRRLAQRNGMELRRQGGQQREFTSDEIKQMDELARQGKSQRKIAEVLGTTMGLVQTTMRLNGLLPARKGMAVGENHGAWKGGRITVNGYTLVRIPIGHPFASMASSGAYVPEHRLVMAEYLGRPLYKWESVHHINNDPADNRIENLQLRIGQHGAYAAYRCSDCGSTRIEPILLD